MNNTAVIIGTYNRAHLLRRSLLHYPADVDIFVYDDGSTDDTNNLIGFAILEGKVRAYRPIYREPGWRDSSTYLNYGIQEALKDAYEYIFITHPEIIPGKTTIESSKRLAVDKETWISCKGYYLTPENQQELTDEADVSKLTNFYGLAQSAEFNGNPEYLPEAVEKATVWHSWIFGGGSREMWQYFGGLTPFEHWGSVDVDLSDRRRIAGMKTVTPNLPTDIVIHQNHDDLGTPRDMAKCMSSLHEYPTKESCLKPQLICD